MLYFINQIRLNGKLTSQLIHKDLIHVFFKSKLKFKIKKQFKEFELIDANDNSIVRTESPFAIMDEIHKNA